ncbi:hypothetical protein [Streptomyces sp. PU_AKi4]|uniref:hypothetical protein n=1 Tax=Streptomyces sp. PU_AKi4 TaxID=2800809 RepID=UPI0035263CFE
MDAHARIHHLLPNLDETTRQELDKQLTILKATTIEGVLDNVASWAGDHTAETVRDTYPHIDAWLRGETPTQEPPLDIEAMQAAAEAEKNQVCECEHYRDKHHRDFHNGGGIICGTCDCRDFTARQESTAPAA